jgi:hypothetical protein
MQDYRATENAVDALVNAPTFTYSMDIYLAQILSKGLRRFADEQSNRGVPYDFAEDGDEWFDSIREAADHFENYIHADDEIAHDHAQKGFEFVSKYFMYLWW